MGVLLSKEEKIVARVKEQETLIIKPLALLKREAAMRLNFVEEEGQHDAPAAQARAGEQPWANSKTNKVPGSLSVVSSESYATSRNPNESSQPSNQTDSIQEMEKSGRE